jgi:hypothetical protein
MDKFDFDKINEAFRTGNTARKKESVQDAVQSVAVNGWSPDEVESLWDDMEFKHGFTSERIDAVNGKFSCRLEKAAADFDFELSITKYDGRTAELFADLRTDDGGWEFESWTGSCRNLKGLFDEADEWAGEKIRDMADNPGNIDEAFKAGNKARKKESAADAAAITDPGKSKVRFKDPFIAKAMKWGGIATMDDCMEEDNSHFKEVINYAKDLAAKSNDVIRYFPEFELFNEVDDIPDNLFTLGKGCALEEITFHDRLAIGSRAFQDSHLREAILSDFFCAEIHDNAFRNCQYLEKVALTSAIECGDNVFANCTGLSEVSIDDYEELYNIAYHMFDGCTALRQIELPAGLKTIDSMAFYRSGLRSITLPASLEYINSQAFGECLNLTTVRFLGDYCEIDDNAFRNCVNLKNIRANSKMFRYLYRYHRELLERLGVPKGCKLLLD